MELERMLGLTSQDKPRSLILWSDIPFQTGSITMPAWTLLVATVLVSALPPEDKVPFLAVDGIKGPKTQGSRFSTP
jgi:hypothetical protein